jgi:hypothetical protein
MSLIGFKFNEISVVNPVIDPPRDLPEMFRTNTRHGKSLVPAREKYQSFRGPLSPGARWDGAP